MVVSENAFTLFFCFQILILQFLLVVPLPFQIDFGHPFDISNSNKNISAMSKNIDGNYFVAYTDKTISVYDMYFTLLYHFPMFSPSIIAATIISNHTTDSFQYYSTSNILTTFSLQSSITTILDITKRNLLFFSHPSGQKIQQIILNTDFKDFIVIPYQFPNIGRVNFLVIIYKQNVVVSVQPNYFQTISYVHNADILNSQYDFYEFKSVQPNQISLLVRFDLTDSSFRVANLMIEIKIYLDPTTSQLVNFTTHPMISFYDYSSFAAVRFFRKHSSYLIVQDILNITMVYDCDYLNYWTLGGSLSTMFYVGIFTYNDIVYYQDDEQLIETELDENNHTIYPVSTYIVPSQYASMVFVLSQSQSFVYVPGRASIVMIKSCLGQNNGENCLAYACVDPNCLDCSFNASICVICGSSYYRNESNYCLSDHCLDPFCIADKCLINFCIQCDNISQKCTNCAKQYFILENQCLLIKDHLILAILHCYFLQKAEQKQKCRALINNPTVQNSLWINKNILSLPYVNQIFIFVSYLKNFNNDYWYYLYHNRNISKLFYSRIFFELITAMNNCKMIPFFINDTQIDGLISSKIKKIFQSNFINYTNSFVLQIDSQATYFIQNIQPMIIWNYSATFIVYFSFLFLYYVIIEVKKLSTMPKTTDNNYYNSSSLLANFFRINSVKSILFLSLLQSNAVFIAFYCTIQFKIMHFEDIFDKINALLCLGFFWSCFVFSIAYYPLNYAFSPKMERYFSERELISNHGAYFCQAFEKFLRGVLFGIVQGLLIADQISLCVVSGMIKVCVIVICGLKHNHYRIKILFWLLVMYFLLGALYDLFFLLTFIFDNGTTKMGIFLEYVCSKIELMLISGLLLTFLLMFVVSMGYFVYTVWGQLEKYVKRCFKMSQSIKGRKIKQYCILPKKLSKFKDNKLRE